MRVTLMAQMEDITELMNGGQYVVMPMDLSGAIAMKRHYPTVIFCKCKREQMIRSILEKRWIIMRKCCGWYPWKMS